MSHICLASCHKYNNSVSWKRVVLRRTLCGEMWILGEATTRTLKLRLESDSQQRINSFISVTLHIFQSLTCSCFDHLPGGKGYCWCRLCSGNGLTLPQPRKTWSALQVVSSAGEAVGVQLLSSPPGRENQKLIGVPNGQWAQILLKTFSPGPKPILSQAPKSLHRERTRDPGRIWIDQFAVQRWNQIDF